MSRYVANIVQQPHADVVPVVTLSITDTETGMFVYGPKSFVTEKGAAKAANKMMERLNAGKTAKSTRKERKAERKAKKEAK